MTRPEQLVVVLGTGTEVGKTWVSCRLLGDLRAAGHGVAARKPAQSYRSEEAEQGRTDADLLALASGGRPLEVCPASRWYPAPMAPPMAADALGADPICMDELVAELTWPSKVAVGLVEAAGGPRSPIAHDGDGVDLARRLAPDLLLVVADPGLGTLNAVRSAAAALVGLPLVVVLNRYDPGEAVHAANLAWLARRDGIDVVVDVAEVVERLEARLPQTA
jgi:dethiobiotin synthetase